MRLQIALIVALFLAALSTEGHAEEVTGEVVSIADGDTLTLLVDRKEHQIRLAEIDAPERGQDWGTRAREALSEKVFRKEVTVKITTTDRYGRLIGRLRVGNQDVNREMVAEGHAWVYRQYMTDRSLLEDESRAKAQGLGLWGKPNPIRPWKWRSGGGRVGFPHSPADDREYRCGSKRYCREMRSCAEARYHLSRCGLARLDGDGDGVPCETLCR